MSLTEHHLFKQATEIARADIDPRMHLVATWLEQHAQEHSVYDCHWEEAACGGLKTARGIVEQHEHENTPCPTQGCLGLLNHPGWHSDGVKGWADDGQRRYA